MIREKILEMIAEGKITLNGCQVNFGGENTQNNYYANPGKDTQISNEYLVKDDGADGCPSLPEALNTIAGVEMMQKLQQGNLIDDNYQPINLSWTEKSVLVEELSARLHIDDKWRAFGMLWHLKPQTRRSAYNKAMDLKKTSAFFDKLRSAIEA